MEMFDVKKEEKKAMNEDEIREMKEQERINSVYPEETSMQSGLKIAVRYIVAAVLTAIILVGFSAFSSLSSYLRSIGIEYLSIIDDSSGFLSEALEKLLQLALAAVISLAFGFFIKINYGFKGRPVKIWSKHVKICLIVAFAADVLFLLGSRLFGGTPLNVSGTIISQIFYYITKILIVPLADILLFVVLPSAIIKNVMTLVSDNRTQIELPLIICSAVIMTFGQLNMSWDNIIGAGFIVVIYALIQSTVYSILYNRTEIIWIPVAAYSGVTLLYYLLSWLLSWLL